MGDLLVFNANVHIWVGYLLILALVVFLVWEAGHFLRSEKVSEVPETFVLGIIRVAYFLIATGILMRFSHVQRGMTPAWESVTHLHELLAVAAAVGLHWSTKLADGNRLLCRTGSAVVLVIAVLLAI